MEDVAGGAPPRRLLPLLPPALLYAAISVQSAFVFSLPSVSFRFEDKLLHGAAYGALAFLLARGVVEGLRWAPARGLLIVAVAGAVGALGVIDEVHQAFVPGRQADVFDGVADVAGAFVGAAAWVLWRGRGNRAWPS